MGDLTPNMHVVTAALWALASTTAAFTAYRADLLCGKEISLGLERTAAAILVLTSSDCRRGDMNCGVKVRSDEGSQIMLSFLSLDLGFGRCLDEYVEISSNGNGSIEGFNTSAKFCKNMVPGSVIISSNNITVRVVSKGQVQGTGFQLMMTQFYQAPCRSGEFTCSNGRCIRGDLVCDAGKYDNCGDHSDVCPLGVNMIISIVVAVVLVILVVFLVGLSLWYRMHSSTHRAERRQEILFMRVL